MNRRTLIALGVLGLAAIIIQVTVIGMLQLPGGGPNLVVVVVASVGLATGPTRGATFGFITGLVADLAPPAAHTVGLGAMVLGGLGWASGYLRASASRSAIAPLLWVSASGAMVLIAEAIVMGVLGDPRLQWTYVAARVPAAIAYDGIMAPFVVPAVRALIARLDPEPVPA